MKKFLIIVLLLSQISCTPLIKRQGMTAPASTVSIEPSVTTTLPEVTATQHLIATATIKRSVTTTPIPVATTTQPVFNFIQKEFNTSEWEVLYDRGWVWQIELGSNEQMWIVSGGYVGYFNGKNWILFSEKDYGFPNMPHDMAAAPDGTVWLAERHAISQYRNDHWSVYPINNTCDDCFARLAIDSSNSVWLAFYFCNCGNSLRIFDGSKWDEIKLGLAGTVDVSQILFTPNGNLWVSFGGAIGQYNGKSWKKYFGRDFWPEGLNYSIRIASDNQGNIYGISDHQKSVIKININESISIIPFDYIHYGFIDEMKRSFIDGQGRIWINACLRNENGFVYSNCLVYYQDNQWISFKDFPFGEMTDMKELSDGTLLIATTEGVFQYKPEN